MTELTGEARGALERYLDRVRLSLRGTGVDVLEVERDIREHIEEVLASSTSPVSRDDLETVLQRLGSPSQWVPEDEVSAWQRMVRRWQIGPEDWRLSYLCFGLTILGFFTAVIGGVALWIPAYFLARAAHSLAAERGEPLGARRWLLYPTLLAFALPMAICVLVGPLLPLSALGVDAGWFASSGIDSTVRGASETLRFAALLSAAVGLWWMVLAALSTWAIRPLRLFLLPLADNYQKRHAWWLAGAGLVVTIASAVALALT